MGRRAVGGILVVQEWVEEGEGWEEEEDFMRVVEGEGDWAGEGGIRVVYSCLVVCYDRFQLPGHVWPKVWWWWQRWILKMEEA